MRGRPCLPARRRRSARIGALAALLAAGVGCGGGGGGGEGGGSPDAAAPVAGISRVRVEGSRLVDQEGRTVQLRGVNRSGAEYACAEGFGIFDGPTDDEASVLAMKTWRVNAVRIPLNEACWLGINGVKPAYGGARHVAAIESYVKRLHAHGMVVILNLHLSAPGDALADDQAPMADRDHSSAFWRDVATTFRDDPLVLFDLFNEPFPDANRDTTAAWRCSRDGGDCPGVDFPAAGMQELVDAVRGAGAHQPLLVAGPQYAGVLDRWTEFAPKDPDDQLAASIHIYGAPLDSPCRKEGCWRRDLAPLAEKTPIVISEFGDTDCTSDFSPPLLDWADAHGLSYTAWAWNKASCADDPSLLEDYDGTPTAYGAGVRRHLLAFPE